MGRDCGKLEGTCPVSRGQLLLCPALLELPVFQEKPETTVLCGNLNNFLNGSLDKNRQKPHYGQTKHAVTSL